MRFSKMFITIGLIHFVCNSYSQTTTIDFTTTPQMNSGTYDPNYWNNGGCGAYHRFGPNPLPVNGHNVRTVGSTLVSPTFTNTSTSYDLTLYSSRNNNDPQIENNDPENAIISVEYPFLANKTYLIELYGFNDHNWNNWVVPKGHYNGVFWLKLENNPEITTNAPNKCIGSLSPVEKSVGRYSKLISDPAVAFEMKTYRVQFSPLENRNALKVIFDCSPIDPNVIIDNIFRLRNIKITEMPYEEESGRYHSTYSNVPAPPRGTPGYDIPVILDNPTSQPGRIITSISVNPNQWGLNTSSTGYSLNLSQLIQNLKGTNLVNMSLMTGRPTRDGGGSLNLPCTSFDNNYSFNMTSNNDVIINVTNPTNTAPNAVINFNITYNNP